jgi:chaperonin cofactor prefoldin
MSSIDTKIEEHKKMLANLEKQKKDEDEYEDEDEDEYEAYGCATYSFIIGDRLKILEKQNRDIKEQLDTLENEIMYLKEKLYDLI